MINKLKSKSEFSHNVLTLMTGTTIAQAIPIAISPILTRIYTAEDFGVFALFLAITGVFSVVASGRYELALMLPRDDEDAINIFTLGMVIISLLTGFIFVVVLLFHSYLVDVLGNKEIGFWLYFVPISFFFIGVFNLLNYYNNRQKNYKDIANATIVKSIVLAMIQLGIGFLKTGASGLISGQIISSLFANLQLLKNIVKDKKLLSSVSKVKMISLAKHYKNFPKYQAPHAMLNTFSSYLPVYMFTPFFGLGVVGLYSLSTRIVLTPMMILAGASAKVYNQKVTQIYNDKGDAYGFTVRVLKSLLKKIILPFVIIIIFAPEIFSFVFGAEWREAGIYTQVLSLWLILNILVSTVSFIPSLIEKQKKAFIVSIIQVLLLISSISIGIYVQSIYVSLGLFSISNSIVLIYNLIWMLGGLKDNIK